MKIAHISDVHIRTLKYHDEYRRVFANLNEKLDEVKPDIVVNTGDTVHSKTQMSPELVQMVSEHAREIATRFYYYIILGNHDMNLMNTDRQDAISPIIESINHPNIRLLKKSGRIEVVPGFNFWVFSLADQENYPLPSQWAKHPSDVNVGLFHGSIGTCITDSNWRMTHVEHELSIFDGLDYALLGDIHKQQFFKEKRIAYAGSLIQQNFGEELEKGFLLWDIRSKNDFDVQFIPLTGSRKFHTVRLSDDLTLPLDLKIDDDSRVRISPPRTISLAQQKEIEHEVKKRFKPHDVITLSPKVLGEITTKPETKKSLDIQDLRQISVQEKLIRAYLSGRKLSERVIEKIIDLNRRYQIQIDQREDTARNIFWKINRLGWNNLFNYGEDNFIELTKLGGLTGIFAPNASGKSNLIDIILQTCFDAQTKGVSKNVHIINDNKTEAKAIADITANGQNFEIERKIERIKHGQKTGKDREWGKTSVIFSQIDENGGKEQLVGTLRPETEKAIRQRLGTFDDFMLTSLSAQWNPMDIISCKETKRKEILFRFLDLEPFEQKGAMAREESRESMSKLKDLDSLKLEETIKKHESSLREKRTLIEGKESTILGHRSDLDDLDEHILTLTRRLIPTSVGPGSVHEWREKIKRIDQQKTSLESSVESVRNSLVAVEASLKKVLTIEERFDRVGHEEKEAEHAKIMADVLSLDKSISTTEQSLKNHQKNVSLLKEVPCGDKFPGCKFLVNAFDSQSKLSDLESSLGKMRKEREEKKGKLEELKRPLEMLSGYRKYMASKSVLQSEKKSLTLELDNTRIKIDGLVLERTRAETELEKHERVSAEVQSNSQVESEILVNKKKKTDLTRAIKTLEEEVASLNRSIGSIQGSLDGCSAKLAALTELRETCVAYENYIQAMGKDGIAYYVLTEKLPLINEEINKILSSTADFGVFIEHDADDQSIRFYLQYGEYKSRLLELGSGAEKFLSSIAIRTALLNISNLPKTNMFIIDEGFGKLDPKNLEAVQRMFDYLKTAFEHVIVISHLDTLKDMVDNTIEITTDEEGYAHIAIGE